MRKTKKTPALTTLFVLVLALSPVGPAAARQTSAGQPQSPPPAQSAPTGAGRTQPTPTPADEEGDVVRITSNLVQLDVLVTDERGRQVTDLTAEDFEILEDGKPREITNFSYVSVESGRPTARTAAPPKGAPAPPPVPPARLRPEQVRRTIALIVDDLGTSFESTHLVRRALKKFVDEEVRPGDLVAILRTSAGMGALQQFTSDKRLLAAAAERVRWYPFGRAGVGAFAPLEGDSLAPSPRGGSSSGESPAERLRERAGEDLDEFREEIFSVGTLGALNFLISGMRELPGRKSVVLFSDGIEIYDSEGRSNRLVEALRRLTDLANRASVTIYAVDARGLPVTGLTAADSTTGMRQDEIFGAIAARSSKLISTRDGLRYLADQTGGVFVRNTNDLGEAVQRAVEDLKGYYLIGYRPDASTFGPAKGRAAFHRFEARVKRAGLKVRARKGFYGFSEDAARPAVARTREGQLVAALASPFGATDVPLRLTSVFLSEGEKLSVVNSLMHIDVSNFKFTEEPDGWRKTVIDVLALTFGDSGQVVEQIGRTEQVRLRGKTYEKVLRDGLLYTMRVPIKKPGAYQLRVAVRDAATERTGSASQFIEVPNLSKGRLALSGLIMRGLAPGEAGAAPAGGDSRQDAEADPSSNAAVRRFRQGTEVVYLFQILNAKIDRATARPQLQTQMRLFRDGQQVFAAEPQGYDPSGQTDPKRLQAGARLRLNKDFPPGEYVLQIVVTDLLAKEKDRSRVATQWIDFEVVK